MNEQEQLERSVEIKSILRRWVVLLAILALFALWATWRLHVTAISAGATMAVDSAHEHASHAESTSEHRVVKKKWYRCTMPECGDVGSDDPNSRCPVCGMKRELVDFGGGTGDHDKPQIILSRHARELAELATEPVEKRLLKKRIRTVGKVTYDETRHKTVSAWSSGRIDRLYADYTGMSVNKEDHLLDLYSPELVSAQEELLQARRAADAMGSRAAEESGKRAEKLIDSARQKLELLGISKMQIDTLLTTGTTSTLLTIYAPLGGTIVHKSVMEGMYVKTGDVLFQIADLSHVWIMIDVYESDLPWITPFQKVKITAEALAGKEVEGIIVFVDPVVDPKTRTIKVRVHVDNPDLRLKPEMFVTAIIEASLAPNCTVAVPPVLRKFVCPMHSWITFDEQQGCPVCGMDLVLTDSLPGFKEHVEPAPILSVPYESVMQTGERSLVYIESEPGTYMGREVHLGPVAQDETGQRFYPVLEGLNEGAMVVTRGNFVIDSQMQLAGKPSLFNIRGEKTPMSHDHGHGGMHMEDNR